MRPHIKLGKIFGIEVGIHYSWFIIAVLITLSLVGQFEGANKEWGRTVVWSSAIVTALLFFACLLAHELSHSLMAKARKIPVRRITLFALGGVSEIEKEANDAKTEFLIAIVGPLTSVVLGGLMLSAVHLSGVDPNARAGASILYWLGWINIYLGVFNMLPGFPLDGGRVLRSIIWWVTGSMERSTKLAARAGQGLAILFILAGIYGFFRGAGPGGLWIAFIGWFLLQAAGANYMDVQIKHALEGVVAGDLMSKSCDVVEGPISVQDFVDHYVLRTGRRCFLVTVMGRLAGLVTPHEVRRLARELWPSTPVQQIMKPLDQVRTVSPETPVTEILAMMAKEDLNQVPVISAGEVVGMVARAEILQSLRSRIELMKS